MRSTLATFSASLILALCAAFVPSAHAANTQHHASATDLAAFQNFQLTDNFFDKYMAVEDDVADDPCKLGMIGLLKGKHKNMSLDEAAAHWDAKPDVHAMLANHDITAKQMLLGMGTLMSAAMQDVAATHPKLAAHMHGNGRQVSAANMAFYKAHKAEIRQHAQTRARKMMHKHNGKMSLPSCMTDDKS